MFKNIISEFANQYGLSTWDWSAIIIAFLSFGVAIMSLIIAIKTLKSQKKTEKNTTPILSIDIQLYLMDLKLCNLYESLMFLNCLSLIFERLDTTKPSEHFWDYVTIKDKDFHLELFYDDDLAFRTFFDLVTSIERYNSDINSFRNIVEDLNSNYELKKSYIHHLLDEIFCILKLWVACYENTFKRSKEEITSAIRENFLYCNHCSFEINYKMSEEAYEGQYIFSKTFVGSSFSERIIKEYNKDFFWKLDLYIEHSQLATNIDEYKILLRNYVECIILNVMYKNDSIGYILYDEKDDKTHAHVFNIGENKSPACNPWIQESSFTSAILDKSTTTFKWIFYLTDIKV